ncbi:hypothetical protein TNIN_23301 [Trichonephila inaurata madagascariensis]|uniref:Uncharacterized protein n=1 Tax=Trichonephila inaurata madagascariensis TaxID=2747483 RepID=A0A8X6YGW4_9ARAC|nr:hypothetical protein TNIN_23301 [Trichonephila inaurata madagascariensis]
MAVAGGCPDDPCPDGPNTGVRVGGETPNCVKLQSKVALAVTNREATVYMTWFPPVLLERHVTHQKPDIDNVSKNNLQIGGIGVLDFAKSIGGEGFVNMAIEEN